MAEVVKATRIGDYVSIDEAARAKGGTYPSTYRWIVRNQVPRIKVGTQSFVLLKDLEGYQPRA